jgi:glycosyltransferase involved in cell wall biosynthesis
MNRLTVLIPCKDEQLNIRPCIESARAIADEILVADSGSTDRTLDIVRELGGCRVIRREYVHSGDFKNWAIPQASCPWVLLVDADERVTPQLAAEIRQLLRSGPPKDGYWIYRENHFLGHRIRYSGWNTDRVIRFFRRDLARYAGDTDHAEIDLPARDTGRLKGRLLHYTYWTYDQYFRKFHRYTRFQAERWRREGRRPGFSGLLLRPIFRFLHAYVVRLGFLDGLPGLQVCVTTAFYSFMKQARLWELYHAVPQPDPEAQRPAIPDELPRSDAA